MDTVMSVMVFYWIYGSDFIDLRIMVPLGLGRTDRHPENSMETLRNLMEAVIPETGKRFLPARRICCVRRSTGRRRTPQ